MGQMQVIQQEELVRQLQDKLNSMEGQVIVLKVFQVQSLEVHTKIEAEKQRLISKVEIIQNYFQAVSESFDNIVFKEKEAKETRATFQKEFVLSRNKEVSKNPKLSVTEHIRGDVMFKVWEANIDENKRISKEIKDDCEEVFDFLDKGSLGIGRYNCTGLLVQINIIKHKLNFKENLNEIQMEISKLKEIDVTLIDGWLVNPNLRLQSIKFADKGIEYWLPKIHRKFYLFEAKDLLEPPIIFVHFLEKCVECLGSKEGDTSIKQQSIILKVYIIEIIEK
jgi:hypothetical protein